MPLYDYTCDGCGYEEERFHGSKSEDCQTKICPGCGELSFKITIRSAPGLFVRDNPKTVGSLAYMNTRKLGKFENEDRIQKETLERRTAIEQRKQMGVLNEKETRPAVDYDHKVDISLAKMTPTQQKRYIETGKK